MILSLHVLVVIDLVLVVQVHVAVEVINPFIHVLIAIFRVILAPHGRLLLLELVQLVLVVPLAVNAVLIVVADYIMMGICWFLVERDRVSVRVTRSLS